MKDIWEQYTECESNIRKTINALLSDYGYDEAILLRIAKYADFCGKKIDISGMDWFVVEGNILFGFRTIYGENDKVHGKWIKSTDAPAEVLEEAKRQKDLCEKNYSTDDLGALHRRQAYVHMLQTPWNSTRA